VEQKKPTVAKKDKPEKTKDSKKSKKDKGMEERI